jgi:hypothetical protein
MEMFSKCFFKTSETRRKGAGIEMNRNIKLLVLLAGRRPSPGLRP